MYLPCSCDCFSDIDSRACEAGESHKMELAKKAIIQKGRDNTRIPIPVFLYPR